jgi:hypothetical protein
MCRKFFIPFRVNRKHRIAASLPPRDLKNRATDIEMLQHP